MGTQEATGRTSLRLERLIRTGNRTVEHFRGTVLTYSRLILLGIVSFQRPCGRLRRVLSADEAESFPLRRYTRRDVPASCNRRRHSNSDQRVGCWGASAVGGIAPRRVETEVRIAWRRHAHLSAVIRRALQILRSPKGRGCRRARARAASDA